MTKVCKLELRAVYGAWKVYPASTEAKAFAEIAGTTTLTGRVLRQIEALGYRLEMVNGVLVDTGMVLAAIKTGREVLSNMGVPQ
jgi:hypothetical protein